MWGLQNHIEKIKKKSFSPPLREYFVQVFLVVESLPHGFGSRCWDVILGEK